METTLQALVPEQAGQYRYGETTLIRADDGSLVIKGTDRNDRIQIHRQEDGSALVFVNADENGDSGTVYHVSEDDLEKGLTIEGDDGDDRIQVFGEKGGEIRLSGGDGNDTLIGSEGEESFDGGEGEDEAFSTDPDSESIVNADDRVFDEDDPPEGVLAKIEYDGGLFDPGDGTSVMLAASENNNYAMPEGAGNGGHEAYFDRKGDGDGRNYRVVGSIEDDQMELHWQDDDSAIVYVDYGKDGTTDAAFHLTPAQASSMTMHGHHGDDTLLVVGDAPEDSKIYLNGGSGVDDMRGSGGNEGFIGDVAEDQMEGNGGVDSFHGHGTAYFLNADAEALADTDGFRGTSHFDEGDEIEFEPLSDTAGSTAVDAAEDTSEADDSDSDAAEDEGETAGGSDPADAPNTDPVTDIEAASYDADGEEIEDPGEGADASDIANLDHRGDNGLTTIHGSDGRDEFTIEYFDSPDENGFAATVTVENENGKRVFHLTQDQLVNLNISAEAGNDEISISGDVPDGARLRISGGDGDDTIESTAEGNTHIDGDAGDDVLTGLAASWTGGGGADEFEVEEDAEITDFDEAQGDTREDLAVEGSDETDTDADGEASETDGDGEASGAEEGDGATETDGDADGADDSTETDADADGSDGATETDSDADGVDGETETDTDSDADGAAGSTDESDDIDFVSSTTDDGIIIEDDPRVENPDESIASVEHSNGATHIHTSAADDAVFVKYHPDGSVTVTIRNDEGGVRRIRLTAEQARDLEIVTEGGDDAVDVQGDVPDEAILRVNTGEGSDTVFIDGGDVRVATGDGDDRVFSYSEDEDATVNLGAGDDIVLGSVKSADGDEGRDIFLSVGEDSVVNADDEDVIRDASDSEIDMSETARGSYSGEGSESAASDAGGGGTSGSGDSDAAADGAEGGEGGTEGGGESGGTAGTSEDDMMMDAAMGTAANETESGSGSGSEGGRRGRGGSWLVALAGALGEMQGKFLGRALENLRAMEASADDLSTAGARRFLVQQGEFQANMQMFSISAQASATAIRSTGEGMAAMARHR